MPKSLNDYTAIKALDLHSKELTLLTRSANVEMCSALMQTFLMLQCQNLIRNSGIKQRIRRII